MRNRIIGIAITLFWLAMMASLLYRYVPGGMRGNDAPPLDTAALADAWHDSDEWMDLRWNALRIGVMRTVARQLPAAKESAAATEPAHPASDPSGKSSYQVAVLIGLDVGFFNGRLSTSARLNERLILDQFALRIDLGEPGASGHSELAIDGLARGAALFVRLERGDAVQYRTVRLERPVALSESLSSLYGRSDLKVGDTYTLPVFDPVWKMQGGVMTVRVAARESLTAGNQTVETLRIESTMGAVKSTTWVDDTGRVWKRTIPPLEMMAIDPAEALKRFPWMGQLPEPPRLTLKDMQGNARGEPFGTGGLLGLLREAINQQNEGQSQDPPSSPADGGKGQVP